MALKTHLKTKNGLNLKAAILVVTALNESRNENYQYQVGPGQIRDSKIIYKPTTHSTPKRVSRFQVSIYACEEVLRDGQPAIGYLNDEKSNQPNFIFDLDDKSNLSRVEQAYLFLSDLYANSTLIDVSDLGLI